MNRILSILCACCALSASAATYFVDYADGNDANAGTATNTAWQRHPFMRGWSGSYSHSAGDQFIFKGGVTWPQICFTNSDENILGGMIISAGGNASAWDYYGVSSSWYVGASFSKPVFSAEGKILGTHNRNRMVGVNASYVVIDSIEFTGFYWDAIGWGDSSVVGVWVDHVQVNNCLFHNFSHDTLANGTDEGLEMLTTYNGWVDLICSNNVFNGCLDSAKAIGGSWTLVTRNTISNVVWAIGFGNTNGATISYNDVGPLPGSGGATVSFAAGHPNAIAHTGQGGGTLNIIGNFIHDTHPEDTSIPVIYLMATGTNATVANVVNNVCWNVGRQCIEADTRGPSYTVHAYNNTLLPRAGLVAMSSIHAPPQVGILYATNNLIISDTGLADVWDQEYSANNTVLTPAAAASDGFTVSNRWQPALGSSTLSAGVLISSVTTDILGTNRAVPFAVGAYEYTSSPAPEPPAAGRVGRVTANTVRAGR